MKKIFKAIENNDYIFSVVTRIIGMLASLLYSIIFSRYFQTSLRGSFSVITTYAEIVVLLMCMGMYQGYPYFKKENKKDIYMEFINTISAILLFYVVIAAFLLCIFWDKYEIKTVIAITPLMFGTQQFNYVVLIENPRIRNKMSIVLYAFDILLVATFYIIAKPSLMVLFIFLALKETAYFVAVVWSLEIRIVNIKPSFRYAMKYIRFGIIPMCTILMMDLNYKADVVMLNYFKVDKSDIGIYSLGLSLAQKVWLIPDALKDILLSKLAKGKQEDEVCKIIRTSIWIVIACSALLGTVGKLFICILFGESYRESYDIMVILLIGVVGMIFYKMIYSYNVVNGLQRINLIILGVAAIVNIIVNCFAIPKYGIIGAAVASAISYNLCGVGFLAWFLSMNKIQLRNMLIPQRADIHMLKALFDVGKS